MLVADDQPDVLEALRLLLKGEGYQRRDGHLAARRARRGRAPANSTRVLMDLNYARDTTGGAEGLDLLSRLQPLDADAAAWS